MKLTQAAFAAILLVASACATKHSQSRDPSGTAEVKQGAQANKTAQAKKDKNDELICEWVEPDTGSHLAQKVCHYPNEVTPESEDPQAPPGGFVPSRPTIQLGGGG
jgi:hypothetical protein